MDSNAGSELIVAIAWRSAQVAALASAALLLLALLVRRYYRFAQQNLIEAIGLSSEHVEHAVQKLVEHIEPRAKTLGLGQSSSHELYQQALTQANKELGRVSGQLAAKNRRLAIRAKFFDALSGFQGELRADAPPQDVLKAIGATAVRPAPRRDPHPQGRIVRRPRNPAELPPADERIRATQTARKHVRAALHGAGSRAGLP